MHTSITSKRARNNETDTHIHDVYKELLMSYKSMRVSKKLHRVLTEMKGEKESFEALIWGLIESSGISDKAGAWRFLSKSQEILVWETLKSLEAKDRIR